jgi:acyl carrier protein phosphodiesterase
MNYLAHAYLSFNHPDMLVGNMSSDYVKGKKQFDYPVTIQKGIQLHRAIDAFTDNHAITKELKQIFSPAVRLYSGAFIDIVYDHFLALHQQVLSEAAWLQFSQQTYTLLQTQQIYFPEKFARMFPYMQQQNWLFNYRYKWGIENSFGGLVRRAQHLTSHEFPFQLFNEHYNLLAASSDLFITEVIDFAQAEFNRLIIV